MMKTLAGCFVCAVAGMAEAQTTPAPKLSKTDVKYVDRGREGMDCDDCAHFMPGTQRNGPGSCKVVAGAISPHGYCVAFTEKRM